VAASTASKIERNVTLRLTAADQHIAGGWRVERVELITDAAGEERRFAIVADAGAARPSHGRVARLGQLEQAFERRTPSDIEPAAREGHERPRAGRPGRRMRRLARASSDTRRQSSLRPEHFGVNTFARRPPGRKAGRPIRHKGRRAAQVEIGIARHAQFGENGSAETAGRVEIDARPVAETGRAVADVTVSAGQQIERGPRLFGKDVLPTVAGTVQPPDLPRRVPR